MVKNNGGNKAKKFASKTFNVVVKATRFATIEGEVYAIVTKMMGGSICEVLCIDGITRQCVIRRKFSGKGKRDNLLYRGKWILVGLRDWEKSSKIKETCDLLEVYSDHDKEKLIKNTKENFRIFLSVSGEDGDNNAEIEFINSRDNDIFSKEGMNDEEEDEDEDEDEKEDEDEDEEEDEDEDDLGSKENNKNIYYACQDEDTEEFNEFFFGEKEKEKEKEKEISSIINKIQWVDINDI